MPCNVINESGSQKVKYSLPSGTASLEIYLYGATVTSWKVHDKEQLFLSEKAILNGSKPIRGGIPIVFPQFGTGPILPEGPQHGFARASMWNFDGLVNEENDKASLKFSLRKTDVPSNFSWPHNFELTYIVALCTEKRENGAHRHSLHCEFVVHNPDPNNVLEFTCLLHTYLRLSEKVHITKDVRVLGLQGLEYVDKVQGGALQKQIEEKFIIDKEVDRIYKNAGDTNISVQIANEPSVHLHKTGFIDTVVWNPWIEKARAMADFGDEEYLKMLCMEVGSVASPVQLNQLQTWKGSQTIFFDC